MGIQIDANAVISDTWTNFKSIAITGKNLPVQYVDDGITYTIFAFDGQTIAYTTTIWKGTVPAGVINGGYSQAQNDSDKSDFTTNWQALSNQQNCSVMATGALGALNANVQIHMSGNQSVGVQIAAGTFIGTIVAEVSFDNGTTWNQTYLSIIGSGVKQLNATYVSANTANAWSILVSGGSGLVRIRVSAYTSGSCNITLRASSIIDETLNVYTSAAANPIAPSFVMLGAQSTTSAPSFTNGLANPLTLNLSGGLRADMTQIGGVNVAATTKGTQGTNAMMVQEFKDSGRVSFVAVGNAVTGVTSEALISLTPVRTVTAGSAATSLTVTAGKTLSLQSLVLSIRNTTTTQAGAIIRVRMLAGTVLVGSQEFFSLACSTPAAVSGLTNSVTLNFPDGFEISGTTQIGISQLCSSTSCTIDVSLIGFEY